MNISDITFNAKPRQPWEAVDLGMVMVQQWWRSLYAAWFIVSLPVFILFQILPWTLEWTMLIIWWLKPLFERTQLYILSRAVFGDMPETKRTLRDFWNYAKPQLFASLTWRRFSTTRSFDMAVIQLEGLSGDARAKRIQTLHYGQSSVGSWLTIIGIHIESFLNLSLFALVAIFLPTTIDYNPLDILQDDSTPLLVLSNTFAYLCMGLVAPFYVAGGFSLYLNRRIHLEGWDIELQFRQLRERFLAKAKLACLALATTMILFTPVDTAYADEYEQADYSSENAHKNMIRAADPDKETIRNFIDTTLDSEVFHQMETKERLVPIEKPKEEVEPGDFEFPWWVLSLFAFLAKSIEVILWILVFVLVAYLFFKYRHLIEGFSAGKGIRRNAIELPPETLFGLKVTKESIPENLCADVLELTNKKEYRAACGLLYRGTLFYLMQDYQVKFKESYTEGDCLFCVRDVKQAALTEYFQRLTGCWQSIAYGHVVPDASAIESLCSEWPNYFQQQRGSDNEH